MRASRGRVGRATSPNARIKRRGKGGIGAPALGRFREGKGLRGGEGGGGVERFINLMKK